MMLGTVKGFKVTDSERRVRVGIAAKNLQDLKRKTLEKFKLKLGEGQLLFQTADGTLVDGDEYFDTLEAQTVLIWVRKGERADTDAEILYKTIRDVNEEYLSAGEKVQEFFTEQMKNKVFKLAEVLKGLDASKTLCSTREDHPQWFEGLDTRAKTKEEYMFRRAQDRIRTYYYKTKDELLKSKGERRPERLHLLLGELQAGLKRVNFYGCYFDRRCGGAGGDDVVELRSLCDETGTFVCQGRWDKERCLYAPQHSINPYSSRETRVVFQTWNLDHRVERSRAILPAIQRALATSEESEEKPPLDHRRIFADLFTTDNLKFVHVICHDKSAHSNKAAGPYLM